jgi:hypothetical protein
VIYQSPVAVHLGLIIALDFPLLAKTPDAVSVVVGVAAALMAIRYLVLRWRARTPRLQLSSVIQATPEDGAQAPGEDGDGKNKQIDAPWVESLLREQLSKLRLSMAEAIPEASSGTPLMEIVEGIGEGIGDKSTLGSALGRLYRAVCPEAAYEVSATVRPRDARSGAISVQIVDRTRRNPTRVSSSRDDTAWGEAARQAAAGVAGALYPQVADKHKGPWTYWSEPVPNDLVLLHDEALRYEDDNCLDQAMGAYHDALDKDPLNPHLRIKIAMLRERLELDLSAWATYRAIADERHRHSWKGPDRRVRLLALYRLAILLGNERVASRWLEKPGPATDIDRRDELTEALAADRHLNRNSWWTRFPGLTTLFPMRFTTTPAARLIDDLRQSSAPNDGGRPGEWAAKRLRELIETNARAEKTEDEVGENNAEQEVRQIFETISLARLEQLDARLRRKPPWRPWRWSEWWRYRPAVNRALSGREFSLSAVRVSKLVARIRIVDSAKQPPARNEVVLQRAGKAYNRLSRRWPFWPTGWRKPVHWLRPRHRLADRRDDAWQFHYNAACVVSRVVGNEVKGSATTRTNDETRLIEAGLTQLDEYVHHAGSNQVRSQADWVAREDDDLIALRDTQEYIRWASHNLPKVSAKETDRTWKPKSRIDSTRMAARIGYAGAQVFAACWHKRANGNCPGVEQSAIWWREEVHAWQALGKVFAGHHDWRTRRMGIVKLERCLRNGGAAASIRAAYRPADSRASGDLSALLHGLSGKEGSASWRLSVNFETIVNWVDQRATTAGAACLQPTADDRSRHWVRIESGEALRASRIWSKLAEGLESELDNPGDQSLGQRVQRCLDSIDAEVSSRNGAHPDAGPRRFAREALKIVQRN